MRDLDTPKRTFAHVLLDAAEAMTRNSVAMLVHTGRPRREELAADVQRRRKALAAHDRRMAAIPRYEWR